MPPTIDPARDLLFGLLALQNGLIDQGQLVSAFHAWTRAKGRPLADHLVALGYLESAHRSLLEGLAAAHLARHDGDAAKSLAAIAAGRSTRESLARLGDPDIEDTLGRVGSRSTQQDGDGDPDRTASYAVGEATSDGQRFRVLRPHARGGLGAVFVALDAELHREVALKQILDSHADDPTSRQRFLLEAEVTGGLEHPGIVPVYGLGTYHGGRPFYAMRFVRGDSLKEAIERFHADAALKNEPGGWSLELRKLLRRFLDVCNALDYAHSRGVLHRDIKPGNVIVGRHGETLVVDWGLAKATGRSDPSAGERPLLPSSASGTAETLPGSALGTPAYMSPEQAEGNLEALGPASDVYSLGATLYCLLTGRPPFEGDVGEVIRKVQRGEFPALRQLEPRVDRALEAVCLKAMALRDGDRYATPRALAEDLERWMADEPVAAWREPWRVRARRQLARHRSVLGALAIAVPVALVSLGCIAGIERMRRREADQNNRQLQLAQKATADSLARASRREELALKAIDSYRRGVSENPDLALRPELVPLRQRLLDQPREFYQQLREEAQAGPVGADPQTSRTLMHANFNLAWIAAETGSEAEAERAYKEALRAVEPMSQDPLAPSSDRAAMAMVLNNLGNLQVNAGRYDEARASHRRSFAIREALLAASPDSASARFDVSLSHHNLGWLDSKVAQTPPALEHYRKARALREALVGEVPKDQGYRFHLAQTCVNLGRLLTDVGRPGDAREPLGRSLGLLEPLVQDNPGNSSDRAELANCLLQLGTQEQQHVLLRNTDAGLAPFQRSLELRESLAREFPSVASYRTDLADSLLAVGSLHRQTKRFAAGEALNRRALAIREGLVRDQPGSYLYRNNLSAALVHLGLLLVDAGRPAEALPLYDRAIAVLEGCRRTSPDDPNLASLIAGAHNNRGLALAKLDRHEEALADYRLAIEAERACLERSPQVSQYRHWLYLHHRNRGKSLRALGRLAEAYAAAIDGYRLRPEEPDAIYDYSCDLAVISGLIGRGRPELTPDERAQRQDYADRAVVELRRAIEAGFREVRHINQDPDFDRLRSRADFRNLITDLVFSVDPFAP